MPNSLSHFHCPSVYKPVSLYTTQAPHSTQSPQSLSVSPLTGIVPIHYIYINTNKKILTINTNKKKKWRVQDKIALSLKYFPIPQQRRIHLHFVIPF